MIQLKVNFNLNLESLRKYFEKYGEICDSVIMVDKNSSNHIIYIS